MHRSFQRGHLCPRGRYKASLRPSLRKTPSTENKCRDVKVYATLSKGQAKLLAKYLIQYTSKFKHSCRLQTLSELPPIIFYVEFIH